MPDDREDELRHQALTLACGSAGSSSLIAGPKSEDVVDRARKYFDFLNGDKDQAEDANG